MELPFYYPERVQKFVAIGGNSFIGLINNTTVLKYPRTAGEEHVIASLQVEARIFEAIGPHDRIIGFQGRQGEGILLDYAPHGSVANYVEDNPTTEQQRLKWSRQTTEAVAVIHEKGVIHCDIKTQNLLLDENLDIKLCDFQGRLGGPDGQVLDGRSCENPKYFMPRDDSMHADTMTDIFALGSTIYHILEGHEPFPELDSVEDEVEITARLVAGRYPDLKSENLREVILKCWGAKYISANEVLSDVHRLCGMEK